jgi:hypothetical protein
MEKLFGDYLERGGKLLHGLWVSSSVKRLQLLDSCVGHACEFSESSLSESSSSTMCSKSR